MGIRQYGTHAIFTESGSFDSEAIQNIPEIGALPAVLF
jgi:hypothetical protein